MRLIDGIPVWGEHDTGTLEQIERCAKTAYHAALMADGHLGYSIPIGGVVAYENAISPNGVGFDISCGMKGVRLDIPVSEVRKNIKTIMDDIFANIAFGVGRKNNTRVDHPLFDDAAWQIDAVKSIKQMAENQLGTVGAGNHFCDLLEDELGRIWVAVHFGSRGLGHKTATYFLKEGGAKDGIDAEPLVLDVDGYLGSQYLACMELCGKYAYAGRNWVCGEAARLLGANIVEEVHNHHNFAWRENHNGRDLWVVRKGATPAFPGQRGLVGGSMGDISVIIEGVENDLAQYSLYSTIHGAGRAMSRTAAKGKHKVSTKERDSLLGWRKEMRSDGLPVWTLDEPGLVSPEMMDEWLARKGIELRGADTDEAPQAYKRIEDVLHAHAGTIKIVHVLNPIGVAMAGRDTIDPFKD